MKSATVMLLSSSAVFVCLIFIPAYAKESLGATAFEVGIIVGVFNFTYLLSSYILGRYADMHGRRVVILSGLVASAVATLTQIVAYDPLTLTLSRGLVGFACGAYPAALLTYAQEANEKMGKFASYGSLGWAVGSVLGGVLGIYWQMFALSSFLFFIGFLIALMLPFKEEHLVSVPRFPIAVLKRNFSVYFVMFIRHAGANAVWVLYTPYLLESLGFEFIQIGIVFAVNPLTQFLVMQVIDRFKSVSLVYVGLLFSIIGFLAMGMSTDFPQMFITQSLIGVSWAALFVGSLKYIMEINIEKATASGLLNSTIGISAIAGPLIGGSLVTLSLHLGLSTSLAYRTTHFAAALMAGIALLILPFIMRRSATSTLASSNQLPHSIHAASGLKETFERKSR